LVVDAREKPGRDEATALRAGLARRRPGGRCAPAVGRADAGRKSQRILATSFRENLRWRRVLASAVSQRL
jgi:hypothetical protein